MSARGRALCIVAAGALLFGVAAGLHAWSTPKLPHKLLRKATVVGEFRVLQVRYGVGEDSYAYKRAPQWKFRAWNALPKSLQNVIPYPDRGPLVYSSNHPAVSIWWAWFDLKTHEPEVGGTSYATVTLDSGEKLPRIWPTPNGEYRQILITDPPRDSRQLRLEFRVWGESVRFTIDNPAYHQP